MTTLNNSTSEPVRLLFQSVERLVVEPADEARFAITARDAERAFRGTESLKQFRKKFNAFLLFLHKWSVERSSKLAGVYFGFLSGATIAICTESTDYDFVLSREIAEMELTIVKQFPWCICDAIQLPRGTWESGYSLQDTIQIYGNGK